VRYFVRHPTTQLMPRKVKTAFDGTADDRALTGIHDIAFRAKIAEDGTRGVEILVGGGTSIMPRVAPVLYDFATLDDGEYLRIAEAVFRIFDRQDWLRVNRARARLKVFVDKFGIEELRRQVDEELKGDWVAERDFSIEGRIFEHDEEADAPALREGGYAQPGDEDAERFARFRAANVKPQKQAGISTVEVRISRGDLSPEQFRGLGTIMRDYSGGHARTTVQQNLVLRWVRDESVYEVYKALEDLGLSAIGPRSVVDVVSCPGTDSCKLGITSSMGLNAAVMERVEAMDITDELTKQIKIKMSGCPNGCSQHHLANIGFYGASIKVGEHTIPAYIPHVGGRYEGDVVYGQRLKVRLAAKRVPEAVERWIRAYEAERHDGEAFNVYADRVGTKHFEELVSDLTMPIEFSLETMNHFIDWNRNVPYQVIRGEGECAV
jgi:sulfite reductase beta subunit-like hemoprotein